MSGGGGSSEPHNSNPDDGFNFGGPNGAEKRAAFQKAAEEQGWFSNMPKPPKKTMVPYEKPKEKKLLEPTRPTPWLSPVEP